MSINLSNRLEAIAKHVERDEIVADIGTDHGYIPIWLMENGLCRSVILSDINQGPLNKAAENIARYLAGAVCDLRLGSGMETLRQGEADTVIIAGMGGILIERILASEPDKVRMLRKLILQPGNNSSRLRRRLKILSGFTIADEEVVKEADRFCEIITVKKDRFLKKDDIDRIREAEYAASELELAEPVYDEFPRMYLNDTSGTALEYIRHKIRVEMRIIEETDKKGRSENAAVHNCEARQRLKAFRAIEGVMDV